MKFGFRVINTKTGEQDFGEFYVDSTDRLFIEDEMDGWVYPANKEDLAIQYSTGLLDVGGKEIFEGDWVCWAEQNGQTSKAKVIFSPIVSAFVLDVSGRHLIDNKYGDYQHLHRDIKYKITEK